MTLKMCANLFGVGLMVLLMSLSTRISEEVQKGKMLATLIRLIHLLTFGTWLGMQFWVTFVAGIKMYFTLTRHTFGHLQSKLFPVYFMLGSCLSVVSLVTYYLMHPVQLWHGTEQLQISGLAVSVMSTMLCALYLEPKTTVLMVERYNYEKERGYGDGVGPIKDLAFKRDDTYVKMTHRFAMVHGFTSMANILSYTGCFLHLWCLASQGVIV